MSKDPSPTVYLDNAATTPIAASVRAALAPMLEDEFGNPSSRHPLGVRASEALDRGRAHIARAVEANARQVFFTSGGTEANNLAMLGAARARGRQGKIVIGPTEHPSIRASALALEDEGFRVETAPLDGRGNLDLDRFADLLDEDTVVVAQMLVNNEFGTIYPVARLAPIVRRRAPSAHFHVDAVQGLGKLELSLDELGADTLALSAHKVHAPKGVGALVTAEGCRIRPLLFGGGQQDGLRPGTENTIGAVGFGEAARLAYTELDSTRAATHAAREAFALGIERVAGAEIVASGDERVDAVCAVRLPGAPAEVWLHHLEARGVMASVGSACQSNSKQVNPALLALGMGQDEARRVMRFSFSRYTTVSEVEQALEALVTCAPTLEALS